MPVTDHDWPAVPTSDAAGQDTNSDACATAALEAIKAKLAFERAADRGNDSHPGFAHPHPTDGGPHPLEPTIEMPSARIYPSPARRPRRSNEALKTEDYAASVAVSTRGDYASRALLSLVLNDNGKPTSVRDIAERTGLPQPYLEQILLALKGAGLVRSKRGVGGGYVMARDPAEVTIGMIVRAVDGPIALGDFGQPHQDGACDHEGQCVLLAIWESVGLAMRSELDSHSLATVAEAARGRAPWPGTSPGAN